MADTMQDMINKLRSLRNCVRSEMPKAISESMFKETKQNFQKEAYLGNGKFEKWKERMYDVHNTPIGIKLPYPKLRRTGRLYNSIKKITNVPYTAGLKTSVPYAQLQNEGGKSPKRWVQPAYKIYRKPPQIPARQFMGVGARTYRLAHRAILAVWNKNFNK